MKPIHVLMTAICLCSLALATSSCHKTSPQPGATSFAYADFPVVNTGDWWRYRLTDSIAGTVDTVTLSVTSASVFSGTRTFGCQITKRGAVADTAIMVMSDTAITFTSNLLNSYKIKLPFSVGDSWNFDIYGDLFQALSYTNGYQVLGHSYNVYTIKRHVVVPDYAVDANINMAKGIGLVSIAYDYTSLLPTARRSALLIDYHLN